MELQMIKENESRVLDEVLELYRRYDFERERLLSRHYGKDYQNNEKFIRDILIVQDKKFYQPVNELYEGLQKAVLAILNDKDFISIIGSIPARHGKSRKDLVNDLVLHFSVSAKNKEWKKKKEALLKVGLSLAPTFEEKFGIAASLFGFYYPLQLSSKFIRQIQLCAEKDYPVLIIGASGTGKELLANIIHKLSEQHNEPFVPINCNALQVTLFESELFGHVKGAFTGAMKDKEGLLKAAGKGTVFLDEIGDLGIAEQVKLLRVLQENEFLPVGSTKVENLDARIIFATNQDLITLINEKKFRNDLYHRINTIKITLPCLSETLKLARNIQERKLLLEDFLYKVLREDERYRHGVTKVFLTDGAVEKLSRHPFPGNYRELTNIYRRAFFGNYKKIIDESMIDFDDETAVTQDKKPINIENMTYDEVETAGEAYKNKLRKEKVIQLLSKHRGRGVFQGCATEIKLITKYADDNRRKNAGTSFRKIAESLGINCKTYLRHK
jgi:transcriptional regulator with GAF, ATPase, and Fis domain